MKSCLFALALLWLGGAVAAERADPFKQTREAFMQAYTRVELTNGATGEAQQNDSEAVRTYPLYPYLQAARIRRALANAGDELGPVDQRAETFVTYYEREPVGRDVLRAWLASLAERRQWDMLLRHYRDNLADDALRCRSFTARIELGRTENLPADIAREWLTPATLPECEQAFEWLRAQNELTPALIEQRVRRALETNNSKFARQIATSLSPEQAAPLLRWAALLENPQRQFDALIASSTQPLEEKALLAGWERLARQDRNAALKRFDPLVRARGLTKETASKLALTLALTLAWDRRSEALQYFKRVVPSDLDDYALEWQARAAMWAGDWKVAANTIAAMSNGQREQARWRYWAGRAAERSGDPQLARQLYESVLIDDNFYSIMAAARLDRPVAPHPQKLVIDPEQLKQMEQLPSLVRARELLLCGMRGPANTEWVSGFEQLAEPMRPQAIQLAASWGWYDQAIATATQLRVFNDYALLYPQPYDTEVLTAAKLTGLQPQLIYGVMRQESLYRHDAVSSAGARGLLQLLPETARRTARKWKRPRPSVSDLFDPVTNVTLGAANLRTLLDKFGGQPLVALAGYNAGPSAAARWLPDESLDPDIWVENIPYNETRNYVQRILWHRVVFSWLKSGEPQKVDTWLSRITPLGGATLLGWDEPRRP